MGNVGFYLLFLFRSALANLITNISLEQIESSI